MNNSSICSRLTMVIGLLSALMVGIGAAGLFGISRANSSMQSIYEERLVPIGQLDLMVRALLHNRLLIEEAVHAPTPEMVSSRPAQIEANMALITGTWQAYVAKSSDAKTQALSDRFEQDRARFLEKGLLPAVAALRSKHVREAQQIVDERIGPLFDVVSADADALIQNSLDQTRTQYQFSAARYELIGELAALTILLGVGLATGLALRLMRRIHRSVDRAVEISNLVAKGDLPDGDRIEGPHEIAKVLIALDKMANDIRRKDVALVNQATAAAADLSEQANKLARMVGIFSGSEAQAQQVIAQVAAKPA